MKSAILFLLPLIVSSVPLSSLPSEIDPEERAHIKNFPGYEVTTDCNKEASDNDRIVFPFPMDTQPIEDYKKKHGDPSRLGVNGENAALLQERLL